MLSIYSLGVIFSIANLPARSCRSDAGSLIWHRQRFILMAGSSFPRDWGFHMDTAPADSDMFTGSFGLSESAAKRIETMLEAEAAGSFFRVAVNGGGCSGFQYEFSIDNARQDDDRSFTSHGVEVVIDEMSLELVDNAELDYVQDLMGAYFSVSNPNATASCGCGTSFSI